MFRQALVPINVEGLYPVRINEPVFRKLPLKARIQDQRLCGLNTFLARGMGPVLSIFNDMCQIEAAVAGTSDRTIISIASNQNIMLDGMTINFQEMRTKIGRALRLLTSCHAVLLQRRKASICPYLDRKFQYLTKESNSVTTLLLGGDLENKVSEAVKVSEVAKKITFTRPPQQYHSRRVGSYRGQYNNYHYPRHNPTRSYHRQQHFRGSNRFRGRGRGNYRASRCSHGQYSRGRFQRGGRR